MKQKPIRIILKSGFPQFKKLLTLERALGAKIIQQHNYMQLYDRCIHFLGLKSTFQGCLRLPIICSKKKNLCRANTHSPTNTVLQLFIILKCSQLALPSFSYFLSQDVYIYVCAQDSSQVTPFKSRNPIFVTQSFGRKLESFVVSYNSFINCYV